MPGCRNKMSRQQLTLISRKSDGVIRKSSRLYQELTEVYLTADPGFARIAVTGCTALAPLCVPVRPPHPDSRGFRVPVPLTWLLGFGRHVCWKKERALSLPVPIVFKLEARAGDVWLVVPA